MVSESNKDQSRKNKHRLLRFKEIFQDKINSFKFKKDPNSRNAITDKREMTDPWWIIIMFIVLTISFGFDINAYSKGNWKDVLAHYDGDHMFCGVSKNQPDIY